MTAIFPRSGSRVDPRFAGVYHGRNPGLEQLVPTEVHCALDVGCGHGGMAAWLARHGMTVDGISWNPEELENAKAVCRNVFCYDLNHGLPGQLHDQGYDLVICSHILEHIAYPQPLLTGLNRVLQSCGNLLVAIPNLFFWADRLKLLRGDWAYQPSGTFDYTHLRWYTRQSMLDLMRDHGFVLTRFVADGWVPLPGLIFFITKASRAAVNRLFCRIFPGLFGRQLLFCFHK